INWREEIWPMQWRLGVQGLVSYFACSLSTPVVFYYHDAEKAGRVGMTWQVVSGLQALALTWIQVFVPRFGRLIAYNQFGVVAREALWRYRRWSGVFCCDGVCELSVGRAFMAASATGLAREDTQRHPPQFGLNGVDRITARARKITSW